MITPVLVSGGRLGVLSFLALAGMAFFGVASQWASQSVLRFQVPFQVPMTLRFSLGSELDDGAPWADGLRGQIQKAQVEVDTAIERFRATRPVRRVVAAATASSGKRTTPLKTVLVDRRVLTSSYTPRTELTVMTSTAVHIAPAAVPVVAIQPKSVEKRLATHGIMLSTQLMVAAPKDPMSTHQMVAAVQELSVVTQAALAIERPEVPLRLAERAKEISPYDGYSFSGVVEPALTPPAPIAIARAAPVRVLTKPAEKTVSIQAAKRTEVPAESIAEVVDTHVEYSQSAPVLPVLEDNAAVADEPSAVAQAPAVSMELVERMSDPSFVKQVHGYLSSAKANPVTAPPVVTVVGAGAAVDAGLNAESGAKTSALIGAVTAKPSASIVIAPSGGGSASAKSDGSETRTVAEGLTVTKKTTSAKQGLHSVADSAQNWPNVPTSGFYESFGAPHTISAVNILNIDGSKAITASGWFLAESQGHVPMLAFLKDAAYPSAIPMISDFNLGVLRATYGRDSSAEASILFGKVAEGWQISAPEALGPRIAYFDETWSPVVATAEGPKYFLAFGIKGGFIWVGATSAEGDAGGTYVPLSEGQISYVDFSEPRKVAISGSIYYPLGENDEEGYDAASSLIVHAHGQNVPDDVSGSQGQFRLGEVIAMGWYPVVVETWAKRPDGDGYLHRHAIESWAFAEAQLPQLRETEVYRFRTDIGAGTVDGRGSIWGEMSGLVVEKAETVGLFPEVSRVLGSPSPSSEVLSVTGPERTEKNTPLDGKKPRFLAVGLEQSWVTARVLDRGGEVRWSSSLPVEPNVISVVSGY